MHMRKKTYIRHQCLEPHILDTGNVFGSLEILARPIFSSLACVVHEIFGYLTESTTFFAEVDDNTTATLLGLLDGLFYTKDEIRSASADIRAKDVATVALIVNTESETRIGVGHLCRVTKDVDGQPTDWGKEELDVMSSNKLGVRSASLLE